MNLTRLHDTVRILCPTGDGEDARSCLLDFFQSVPFSLAIGLRCLFWIVWWAPVIVLRRFTTLRGLSPAEQTRYFAWWQSHRWHLIREIFTSVKIIALLVCYGREWGPH